MPNRTATAPVRPVAPQGLKRGPKPRFTEAEAREVTDRIKRCGNDLWVLVAQAHQRKAWAALAYKSWKAYVESEFYMSESRSYQLLDAGKVVSIVREVYGEDSNALEAVPTSREAAKAVAHLSEFKSRLRSKKAEGEPPAAAMRAVISTLPSPLPKQRPGTVEDSMARHPAGKKATFMAPQAEQNEALTVPRGAKACPVCLGYGYLVPAP